MLVKNEEGFVSVTLQIDPRQTLVDGDGVGRVVATGTHDGSAVGLAVRITNKHEPFTKGPKVATRLNTGQVLYGRKPNPAAKPVQDGVVIESIGSQSDAFVQGLAKLYGLPGGVSRRMKEAVPFTSYLHSGEGEPLAFKLFGGTNHETTYSEVYLEIDVVAATLTISEKDPDYRAPLIATLAR